MGWSEGEILSLIELVKYELSLYDISRPDHHDWSKINSTWNKIGRRLNKKGFQAKSMWSKLTKTYVWLIQSKDYDVEEESTWPYFEAMNFLNPFVKDYVVSDKINGEKLIDLESTLEAGVPVPVFISPRAPLSGTPPIPEHLENPFNADVKSDDSLADDVSQGTVLKRTPSPALSLNGLARKKNMEIEDALCQYLKKKIMKEKDPNEFFLSSVAHDMKMLSGSDQVVFKMKVQQLLVEMISKSKC